MYSTNKQLDQLFKQMAIMYTLLDESDRFRAIAYEKAARIIANMEDDIANYTEKELENFKGIGHGIATKIEEFIATGKIDKYEELKSQVPFELIEMVSIRGFGPKTVKTIYEELNIKNPTELINALKDGRVLTLKGFGVKKVENMIKAFKLHKQLEERIGLWDAMEISNRIVAELRKLPEIINVEVAGSVRRCKETIGDLDILVSCKKSDRSKIIEYFTTLKGVTKQLVKGDTKTSVLIEDYNRQMDLRVVSPEEWGAALVYFTGAKQHNIRIRNIGKENNLKINEYGVFNNATNNRIAGVTEEEVYKALRMQWIPPEIREDNGEVEAALTNKIPELVEVKDIIGDLQMHSTWSDGMNSIEEIATYVRKNFNYEYIVISDHSKASRVAGGIGESDLLKQIKEIKAINKKLGTDFIKTGIEVDINIDGSLDITDKVLGQLDWVVASIHSNFNRDNTDRIIAACKNSNVHAIGHPFGRLIGSREPYSINFEKVIEAAKETGTALEINAQPDRMDLSDKYVRLAVENGVKLIISSDSHSYRDFNYMKLGVAIARRGWCKKEDILNTKSWEELMHYFQKKKKSVEKLVTI